MRLHLGLLGAGVFGLAVATSSPAFADPECGHKKHDRWCGGYFYPVPVIVAPAPVFYVAPIYAPIYVPVPAYRAGVAVALPGVAVGINIPLR